MRLSGSLLKHDAVDVVSGDDGLSAFIWDSSRLEHEAAKDCDLTTAGAMFGRSGYGIGMRKESPWISDISMQILNYHESRCF